MVTAIACYERALDLYRRFGDRYNESEVLHHLGDTHRVADRADLATETWRQAIAILDELDHRTAAEIRQKLDDVAAEDAAEPGEK